LVFTFSIEYLVVINKREEINLNGLYLGDIHPETAAGKFFAVFTMVVGVSTLAVVTARIAQFLVGNSSSK